MIQIDPLTLDAETNGVNLQSGTWRAPLGDTHTLLVFLRRFG